MNATNAGTFLIGGDLPVHRMGFGAMRLIGPQVYGEPLDRGNSLAVLRRAVDLGIDFIDTAEAYGPGIDEELIAEALFPYAPKLVIATKCGIDRRALDFNETRMKGSPEQIRASCEGSLSRLKLERIDLYQLHRIDPAVPLEDSIGELGRLQAEGKIRHIGVSEFDVEQLKRACAVAPITTVQNRYNIIDRNHEPVLEYCEENAIGFIPWYPLGAGPLSAADGPLAPTATRLGATPAQIALAWLLARSPVMLLIPGTASVAHLEQNTAAVDVQLSDEDMTELGKLKR